MSEPLQFFLDPSAKEAGVTFSSPRDGDAGFDIRASENLIIETGKQVLVPTGLRVAIPEGYVGLIRDRSSMAIKRVYTHAGVIDAGYRGEVKVVISNQGDESYQIELGDKVAQMVVVPCIASVVEVESEAKLGLTDRGDGGFGSTGRG
jgi:dUTP pyrophosphatase